MDTSATGSYSNNAYGYSAPTRAGMIPFTPPGSDLKCKTAYWLWGELDSKVTPLIVLHGGPGAPGRDWKPITILHERCGIPVLLYDQIGCGESTHLRDLRGDTSFWTNELFLSELENVKKFFEIKTFDLLGHSCGGMLAVMYALTQPPGLRKLIIASASPSEELRARAQLRQRAALPVDMRDAMVACEKEGRFDAPEYRAAQEELGRRHLCRLDPWPAEMHECIAFMEQDDTVTYTLYGEDSLHPTGSRKDFDVVGRLPEITQSTVPGGVLLTNGRYDMVDDEGMAPIFMRIGARVKWVRFGESSHMAQLEEPQAFLTALQDFLAMA